MAVNLYYRIDATNPPIPSSNVVLGVPLSMLQIDANWKSVSDNLNNHDNTLKEHGDLIATKAPINNPKFTGYVTFPDSKLDYPNTIPEGSVYFNTVKQTLMVKNNGRWSSLSTGDSLQFYLPLAGGTMTGDLKGVNGEFFGFLKAFNPDADPNDEETKTQKVATIDWVNTNTYAILKEVLGIASDGEGGSTGDSSMTIEQGNIVLNNGYVVAKQLYGDIDCGVMELSDL